MRSSDCNMCYYEKCEVCVTLYEPDCTNCYQYCDSVGNDCTCKAGYTWDATLKRCHGLIFNFKFNKLPVNGLVTDDSGNNITGRLGSTTATETIDPLYLYQRGYYFAQTDYIIVQPYGAVTAGLTIYQSFTIEAWVR
jgi:hypothetical protein